MKFDGLTENSILHFVLNSAPNCSHCADLVLSTRNSQVYSHLNSLCYDYMDILNLSQ